MTEPFAYIQQGDPVAAVIDILQSAPEIQALKLNAIAGDDIGYQTGMRWLTVWASGGTENYPVKATARVDLDCYAPQRDTAYLIASTAVAVLQREQSVYRGCGLKLIAVTVEMAPYFAGHNNDSHRYICSLRMTIRPLE